MEGNEEETRHFSVVSTDRTRGNGHKFIKTRKFNVNTTKHFFTIRVVKDWNRLPREVVQSPSVEILKSHLDMVLGNLL